MLFQIKARLQLYNEQLAKRAEPAEANQQAASQDEPQSQTAKKAPKPFYLSDRRLLKISKLLKASAFLHGRQEVSLTDLALIPYCLWDTEEQMATARHLVAEVLEQHSFSAGGFEKQIEKLQQNIAQHLQELQEEQTKADKSEGSINPRLQQAFEQERKRLEGELANCRAELERQKQGQLGTPLFDAGPMLQALSKGYGSVQAQLDVLASSLKLGQLQALPKQPKQKQKASERPKRPLGWQRQTEDHRPPQDQRPATELNTASDSQIWPQSRPQLYRHLGHQRYVRAIYREHRV